MNCPACGKDCQRFMQIVYANGKNEQRCDRCMKPNSKNKIDIKMRKPSKGHLAYKFDRFELPKETIKKTQERRPTVKVPDTPYLREIASADKINDRVTLFAEGNSRASSRNERVMKKLVNKLGANPKILFDDGFKVVAERADSVPMGR